MTKKFGITAQWSALLGLIVLSTIFRHLTRFRDYKAYCPPAAAISAHAESSLFEPVPGEGYSYSFIRRILPDLTFSGSVSSSPAATITITPQDYPGATSGAVSSSTITRATALPETYTEQSFVRIRGREIMYKISSNATGVRWRDGTPRIEVRPDGRR